MKVYFCKKCGNEVNNKYNVCKKCGTKVNICPVCECVLGIGETSCFYCGWSNDNQNNEYDEEYNEIEEYEKLYQQEKQNENEYIDDEDSDDSYEKNTDYDDEPEDLEDDLEDDIDDEEEEENSQKKKRKNFKIFKTIILIALISFVKKSDKIYKFYKKEFNSTYILQNYNYQNFQLQLMKKSSLLSNRYILLENGNEIFTSKNLFNIEISQDGNHYIMIVPQDKNKIEILYIDGQPIASSFKSLQFTFVPNSNNFFFVQNTDKSTGHLYAGEFGKNSSDTSLNIIELDQEEIEILGLQNVEDKICLDYVFKDRENENYTYKSINTSASKEGYFEECQCIENIDRNDISFNVYN